VSTNYYAFGPIEGNEKDGSLHIGKKSVGWRFLFRAHPEKNLMLVPNWIVYLSRPDVLIEAEYGVDIPLLEMLQTMLMTVDDLDRPLQDHSEYLDNLNRYQTDGFDFCQTDFC